MRPQQQLPCAALIIANGMCVGDGQIGVLALAILIAAAIGGGCYWNGKRTERTSQLINVQAALPATRVAGAPIGGGPFVLQEAVAPMPHQQTQGLDKSAAP